MATFTGVSSGIVPGTSIYRGSGSSWGNAVLPGASQVTSTAFNPQAVPVTSTKSKAKTSGSKQSTAKTESLSDTLRDSLSSSNTFNMTPEALEKLAGILSGSDKDSRTAALSRKLIDEVLPEIFGSAEFLGTGGNALAQLLGQDAAIRTVEAQSRTVVDARNQAISQGLQGAQVMTGATAGTSSASRRIMEALGLAKGATQQSTAVSTEAGKVHTVDSKTGSETSTGTQTGTGDTVDPLAFAKLQSDLAASSGPSASEKAIATFIAQGGDSAYLSGGSAFDSGLGDYQRKAYQNILSAMR